VTTADEKPRPISQAPRFLPELLQHAGVDPNGDQLARGVTKGRPAHPPHRRQLCVRRFRDVAEVNLSRGTLRARDGSRAAH
jgi:hypothetical protein